MKLTPIPLSPDQVLYEQVADRLQELVLNGTLKPGDRLPSVRKLRQQLSVSVSTVLEAYRVLEDRGLISARPQSGYYVKQTALHRPPEPPQTDPQVPVTEVNTSLALQIYCDSVDPNVVPLGASIPSTQNLPTEQLNRLMGKILRENPQSAHAYNQPLGCPELRSELARRMLDAGCSVHPDQLVITNGTVEAVYLSLKTVTQPGDTVAIESPTYFTMLETMRSLQLKAYSIPTHPRDGISVSHLEEALQSGQVKVCLLVSNFSNPLGSCMDDLKKKSLVDLLNRYQIPLIEDDIYGDLNFEGTRPKAIKAFDTENRVLYCCSVSKTLSPGMRIGWCAGGSFHPQIVRAKSVLNLTTSTLPQLTLAAFLANGGYDRHLRQLRRIYQHQSHKILQGICDHFPAETRVTQPRGGQVLWVEMPEGFNSLQFYRQAMEKGISISPGPLFSPSGDSYLNCFRLSTAMPWSEVVAHSIKTLGHLIKTQLIQTI